MWKAINWIHSDPLHLCIYLNACNPAMLMLWTSWVKETTGVLRCPRGLSAWVCTKFTKQFSCRTSEPCDSEYIVPGFAYCIRLLKWSYLLTKLMEYIQNFTISTIKFIISEINSTDNGIYLKPPKKPKGTIHTTICHTANIRSHVKAMMFSSLPTFLW